MVASVPELTIRNISMEGINFDIFSANCVSASVGYLILVFASVAFSIFGLLMLGLLLLGLLILGLLVLGLLTLAC